MQQIFNETRFTTDFSQHINETSRMYGICSRLRHLSATQKTGFFVHILDGTTRKFYFDSKPEDAPYYEVVRIMMRDCLSGARQLQVRGHPVLLMI